MNISERKHMNVRGIRRTLGAILVCASFASSVEAACLEKVKRQSGKHDTVFDNRFDVPATGTQSFSCDLFVSASDARAALDDFRSGVLYDDAQAIVRVMTFPLDVVVYRTNSVQDRGETTVVHNAQDWIAFARRHLDPANAALIACANVRNVTVVTSRSHGFMIGPGTVWFRASTDDGVPRVISVALRPLTNDVLARDCAVK